MEGESPPVPWLNGFEPDNDADVFYDGEYERELQKGSQREELGKLDIDQLRERLKKSGSRSKSRKPPSKGGSSRALGYIIEQRQKVSSKSSYSSSAIGLLRVLREAYDDCRSRGKELEAISCLKQACVVKRELFGAKSKWTQATELDLVKVSNVVGSKLLRQGSLEGSCRLLLEAHEFAGRDRRAESATLTNISVCMYSQGLVEDGLRYLELVGKNHYFRAETHLNRCACHFKLGSIREALFHAQSAVKYAQSDVQECFKASLPLCFRREALVVLALSYHALGICLGRNGLESDDPDEVETKENNNDSSVLGFVGILTGIKWHIKAYEEVALEFDWAIPNNLKQSLWRTLIVACSSCSEDAAKAFNSKRFHNRPDLEFLCSVVMQQVNAARIQHCARSRALRRESSSARKIQKKIRAYLRRRKTSCAAKVQALARSRQTRKSYLQVQSGVKKTQKIIRGRKSRKDVEKIKSEKISAVKCIQARSRGYLARKQAKQMKESANVIQKVVRGHSVRIKDKEQCDAADPWEETKTRHYSRKHREIVSNAVEKWRDMRFINLQQGFFAFKGFTEWSRKEEHQEQSQAALTLQKYQRKRLERRRKQEKQRKTIQAATLVQSTWRGHTICKDFIYLRDIAIQIQTAYRGYCGRKHAKLAVIAHSIIMSFRVAHIQRIWRKKTVHNKNAAAIKIQYHSRRNMRKKKVRKQEATAAVAIQSRFRGHMLRKNIHESEVNFDKSIVRLQSWVRQKQAETIVNNRRRLKS
mmetsp:Transcript_21317/g.34686  ORF Transcript_21317/g.34686 Transcript_21317/m.34686 type:complete len:758 (+) Transcript_21317:898-3171(+)